MFDRVRVICIPLFDFHDKDRLASKAEHEVQASFLIGVSMRDAAFALNLPFVGFKHTLRRVEDRRIQILAWGQRLICPITHSSQSE